MADSRSAPMTRRVPGWLLAALAGLTVLLGALVPLAPVVADDPVVSWPRAGEPPASTVLPLSPYRPLQLAATVPCATLRALDARGGGEALRTLPTGVGTAPGEGLVVAAADGRVVVSASGAELATEALPGGPLPGGLPGGQLPADDCRYQVAADAGGVRVSRDGTELGASAALPPQVAQLATDAEGLPAAAGLAVTLHPDARYESRPSALKVLLLFGHALALAVLLVLAWRRWPGVGRSTSPGLVRPRPSGADAAVLGVSLAWWVIGPVNVDDSWYQLMARNAGAAGYVGNYVQQFNVTENPFALSQYLLQSWGELAGWSLLADRALPVIYGLGTWVLLRVLVATVLGSAHDRLPAAPWALLVAHLAWWLPYGLTLRPEPLVVLGTAAVLVLTEAARRRCAVGVLVAAVAAAALTVTVAPTGLVAATPLLLAAPWVAGWARAAPGREWVAAGAAGLAALTVVVPVAFADATLGDVREATAVHQWYYRTYPWYEEFEHYVTLLEPADTGAWAKRLPVLMTLAALVAAVLGTARRAGTGGPVGGLLRCSAALAALALLALAPTPTKFVNHFGAIAAPATVLLAAAMLRTPVPRRAGRVAGAVAAGAVGVAAVLSFAGPNLWRPFSDWGQPFGNHLLAPENSPTELARLAPHLGPFYLRNPLLWLAVAAAALGYAAWRGRSRTGRSSLTTDRAVLTVATSVAVLLALAAFVYAPARQYPGWSVALGQARALTGQSCELASGIAVLADADPGLGPPLGQPQLAGDMQAAPLPGRTLATAPASSWHTGVLGGTGTGAVTTPWYPLPPDADNASLVVALAGELGPAQQVSVQVGTGNPAAPTGVVAKPLTPRANTVDWVERPVRLAELPVTEPTAVRVVALDRVPGEDSWLAVSAPRLARPEPVATVTAGRPVFADQVSAALWPCVDQVRIADGIAEAPAVRLRAGDGLEDAVAENATFPDNGGTLVQLDRTARFVELPSTLSPPGVEILQWGHVELVVYDQQVGLVDVRVETQPRAGWVRLPTLAQESYAGRRFTG